MGRLMVGIQNAMFRASVPMDEAPPLLPGGFCAIRISPRSPETKSNFRLMWGSQWLAAFLTASTYSSSISYSYMAIVRVVFWGQYLPGSPTLRRLLERLCVGVALPVLSTGGRSVPGG